MNFAEADQTTTLVLVGHVDHGKSTLIGRLLFDTGHLSADKLQDIQKTSQELGRRMEFAYATDQFREEREANVTIDTTQTSLPLENHLFLLIDAPGHKEYLKNMITGATQAHHAILMLDVQEGAKEQTEKHLQILKLLGIKDVAVMINKMDLVNYDEAVFKAHQMKIEKILAGHGFHDAPTLPISAYNGDNVATRSARMNWYHGPTVVEYFKKCASTRIEKQESPLRFPVQMVLKNDGVDYLLGRVETGEIKAGQAVTLFPSMKKVIVKSILKYNQGTMKSAASGECVALILDEPIPLQRGDVICGEPQTHVSPSLLDVDVFWAGAEPLTVGEKIKLECRSQNGNCDIMSLADILSEESVSQIKTGDVSRARLKINTPMLLESFEKNQVFSRIMFHRSGQVVGCGVVVGFKANS